MLEIEKIVKREMIVSCASSHPKNGGSPFGVMHYPSLVDLVLPLGCPPMLRLRNAEPNAMDDAWDDLIFSETREHWLKVARIVGRVSDRVPNGPHFERIAARIQALVNEGKLEAKGDVTQWRFSEVRLPQ